MEWTREKTLLLISQYRCRRGLWDMTCDEYRKKDVKQRLLNEVSQVLGGNIAINELEKKFHTLRTQYHREISRMKRKEPYNSKWFGFKNLEFLSSPYACRSTKGRLKTDLQGDERKFALGEVTADHNSDNSTPANQNSSNMNEEYLRKSHASSRAQELEKLIEETTKDVDDIDEPELEEAEAKPKQGKELSVRYVSLNEQEETETLENHHQTLMDLHHQGNTVEAVSFQANESGELHYQSTQSAQSTGNNALHVVPTRIIKIQRRDTAGGQEDSYFEEHTQLHPPQAKRMYYEASPAAHTHNTTSILSPALETNANGTASSPGITMSNLRLPKVNTPPKPAQVQVQAIPSPPPPTIVSLPPARDEFTTYGEYVANEMRAISNREVLVALKHRINTAIFEANMAEITPK
ncbi:uncharacterized protein LOC128252223 [Drosophila gunungcola]|uniref:MADF domain-containing protein n=1 Tax=Drosophila gunungcola TaxID=103775 RepID=A0A9P9YYG6_9MUSC|nr:uncharacterized protein LOC128252223 [Drosophila gunungcola]KAI8044999.1 hypothetical protein M5D96_001176 [Drosophila gunungcola]